MASTDGEIASGTTKNISLKHTDKGLSSTWKVDLSHVGAYTGGKVELCSSRGENQDTEGTFLVCMCNDDVALIDTKTGVLRCLLQGGYAHIGEGDDSDDENDDVFSVGNKLVNGDDDDDDDDEIGIRRKADAVTSFAVNSNGKVIVTATENLLLRYWDISEVYNSATGRAVSKRVWKALHTTPIISMAYETTGTLVATGGSDRTVKVWDAENGFCTHNLKGHGGIVSGVYFHPNSNRLQLFACSEDDCAVRVWDLKTHSCVACLSNHLSFVSSIAFSQDGWTLLTGGRDKVVNFWSLRSTDLAKSTKINKKGKKNSQKPLHIQLLKTTPVYEMVEGLEVLPTNMLPSILDSENAKRESEREGVIYFLTAGDEGSVRTWKYTPASKESGEKSTCKCITTKSYAPLRQMILGRRSRSAVLVTVDHNFVFTRTRDMKPWKQIVGYNDEIIDVKYIPVDHSCLLKRLKATARLRGENVDDLEVEDELAIMQTPSTIAVATNSSIVRTFDCNTFHAELLEGHTDTVLCLDPSPDGCWLATASKDNTIRVWNISTASENQDADADEENKMGSQKRCVAIGIGHTESVGAICFNKKASAFSAGTSSWLVSGSLDRTIKLWDLRPLVKASSSLTTDDPLEIKARESQLAHDKDINAITIAPNDKYVATASQDKTIKLWTVPHLRLTATLRGHKRGVWCLEFSKVDRCLASGSGDRTIKIWSMVDFTCLRTFEGHTASVLRVGFVKSGMQLMSSGADGLVKLWTVRTNECVNTFDNHNDKVWGMAIRPDGMQIVSGGGDSRLSVWRDVTVQKQEKAMKKAEQRVLKEQKLSNLLREGKLKEAILCALDLGFPRKLLDTLYKLMEQEIAAETSLNMQGMNTSIESMDDIASAFSDKQLWQMFQYVRVWNTNAKHSLLAHWVIEAILRAFPPSKLSAVPGIKSVLAGLLSYSERHFNRLDRLLQTSYLLDYSLSRMDVLLPMKSTEDIKQDKKRRRTTYTGDVGQQQSRLLDMDAVQVGGASSSSSSSSESDDVLEEEEAVEEEKAQEMTKKQEPNAKVTRRKGKRQRRA